MLSSTEQELLGTIKSHMVNMLVDVTGITFDWQKITSVFLLLHFFFQEVLIKYIFFVKTLPPVLYIY